MRFVSDAQRRAVFAQLKDPYSFNIPGDVQPVRISLDRGAIEQRFMANAALMKHDQARLAQVPEGDEASAFRLQHSIGNYKRRMNSSIAQLIELGVDPTPYREIRDGRKSGSTTVDKAPIGRPIAVQSSSPLQSSVGVVPPSGDASLIATSISPGVPLEMSGSHYQMGESIFTSPPRGRYQGILASIMPTKWKEKEGNI